MKWWDRMPWSVFWMLSSKPTFSLSSFTFIKRLFNSSSLSAIKVVSSAYLRLLIFLPAILIPACASSSPVFLMMYSAYNLNNQGDKVQPWHTPFPIWNQSVVPCPVLTVASWPAYRFLKRQVRWSGIPISFLFFLIFFSFIFISWRLITLKYCSGLCHTLTWISHGFTCVPHPNHPLLSPSPSHPSGSSQCTCPEHLSHASNLGWWSVSPLIAYLFQCYSLRTSNPRLLPQSPKVYYVHLCLFFCFAYRVNVTIFLNSIYMH